MGIKKYFTTKAILQEISSSTNSLSDSITSYTNGSTFYGCLDMINNKETFTANQTAGMSQYIFFTDYTTKISFDLNKRLKINNDFYRINYSNNVTERKHHIELYLSKVETDN